MQQTFIVSLRLPGEEISNILLTGKMDILLKVHAC
jgi:hypothetical protein